VLLDHRDLQDQGVVLQVLLVHLEKMVQMELQVLLVFKVLQVLLVHLEKMVQMELQGLLV
jgi:hypothetical protein